MKSITVRGTGRVTASPDYIVISFRIEARNRDYEKTMATASRQIELANDALVQAGFEKGSLKTTDFSVQSEHEHIHDKNGNYKSVFVGYCCCHQMKLAFDFDSRRLGIALSAIASATIDPQLSIAFTVKDQNAVSEALLKNAAENARRKAELLCSASGARLGQLASIDYSWQELNLYSETHYTMEDKCMAMPMAAQCFDADIEPDDITVHESVTFVWEIE